MDLALLAVLAVVTLVLVSVFARRLGVAAPVMLVILGVGIALLPGTPAFQVPPGVVLEVVLPPLLYSAAIRVPVVDLRRNLRPIGALSVFLVIGSALAVAVLLRLLVPDLGFGVALALGAVVSPTDAVAATTVAKRLGLPPRLVTLLEGEGLVNDASALVMLKVALGAAAAGITAGRIAGALAYAIVVSVAIGLVIGVLTVRFRARLKDPVLDSVVSFAVPFIAYLPVEALGASGVLAVVTAGIYSGHVGTRLISAPARLSERVNWSTVQFVLENGVFLLMGLQLKRIIADVHVGHDAGISLWEAVLIGLLLAAALLVVRAIFVAPVIWQQASQQRDVDRIGERLERAIAWLSALPEATGRGGRRREAAQRRLDQHSGDVADLRRDRLDARAGVVATWAGMRGVVTLAAAQSLPEDTPHRAALVLIAFTVALVTLVVQGGTLPWVVRLTRIRGTDETADARELAALMTDLSQVAEGVLDNPDADGITFDDEVVERLRRTLASLRGRAQEAADDDGETVGPHAQYRMLLSRVLDAERDALLEARSRGQYASRVLERAQRQLDAEEARLRGLES